MEIEIFRILLEILIFSMIVFGVLMSVMVFFFGISLRDTIKNSKGVIGLIILLVGIPAGIYAVKENIGHSVQAYKDVKVGDIEMVPVGGGSSYLIVNFSTSKSVFAFLEYKNQKGDFIPILPTGNLTETKNHSFLVDTKEFPDKGSIYVVIKNEKKLLEKL